MTNIHSYPLQHSPQHSLLYKEETSNIHYNIHLNADYKEDNIHFCNKNNYIDTIYHDNYILVNVDVNIVNRRKQLIFYCFSTEVNVALLIREHCHECCFEGVSRSEIPCMCECWRFFAHVYVFCNGRISCNPSFYNLEVLN